MSQQQPKPKDVGIPGETHGTDGPVGALPTKPECPFCSNHQTELMSPFGTHASVSTYWCTDCRSPFELFRWR